jgi:hypothetical protein
MFLSGDSGFVHYFGLVQPVGGHVPPVPPPPPSASTGVDKLPARRSVESNNNTIFFTAILL